MARPGLRSARPGVRLHGRRGGHDHPPLDDLCQARGDRHSPGHHVQKPRPALDVLFSAADRRPELMLADLGANWGRAAGASQPRDCQAAPSTGRAALTGCAERGLPRRVRHPGSRARARASRQAALTAGRARLSRRAGAPPWLSPGRAASGRADGGPPGRTPPSTSAGQLRAGPASSPLGRGRDAWRTARITC